jgi:flagellar hook-associated protein 3 FlgL
MIGRMSSDQIHQSGLDVILDAQKKLSRTQEELASGKRLLTPADDPVATAQIQSIRSELSRIETMQSNISRASSELAMVEDSVASVEGLLMRARELAVRGANDSLSLQDREIIATEVDALREQLIATANTQSSDGDYIYAGYAVSAAPYTDATVNATYAGDTGVRAINIASGLTVSTRFAGEAVFGQGSAATGQLNAFEALAVLSAGLRGNASAAITSLTNNGNAVTQDEAINISMQALDTNLETVRSVRTQLGVRMNRVDDQQALNANFNVRLQETLSGLEDLDYTKAITEMNLQMVALEAAQMAYTKTQSLSLFNYM